MTVQDLPDYIYDSHSRCRGINDLYQPSIELTRCVALTQHSTTYRHEHIPRTTHHHGVRPRNSIRFFWEVLHIKSNHSVHYSRNPERFRWLSYSLSGMFPSLRPIMYHYAAVQLLHRFVFLFGLFSRQQHCSFIFLSVSHTLVFAFA